MAVVKKHTVENIMSRFNRVEVGFKRRNVMPIKVVRLSQGGQLVISKGSVVSFAGDAIVNAANTGCLGGGGVDGAISAAGGPKLLKARKALPILKNRQGQSTKRCQTGDAVITVGGNLKSTWCIHAVGPNYCVEMQGLGKSAEQCDHLLYSAYLKSMQLSQAYKLQAIGFSLISAGSFRGPRSLQQVLDIAVAGITKGDYIGLEEVHLIAFTVEEEKCLCSAASLYEARNKEIYVHDPRAQIFRNYVAPVCDADDEDCVATHDYMRMGIFDARCRVCNAKNAKHCQHAQIAIINQTKYRVAHKKKASQNTSTKKTHNEKTSETQKNYWDSFYLSPTMAATFNNYMTEEEEAAYDLKKAKERVKNAEDKLKITKEKAEMPNVEVQNPKNQYFDSPMPKPHITAHTDFGSSTKPQTTLYPDAFNLSTTLNKDTPLISKSSSKNISSSKTPSSLTSSTLSGSSSSNHALQPPEKDKEMCEPTNSINDSVLSSTQFEKAYSSSPNLTGKISRPVKPIRILCYGDSLTGWYGIRFIMVFVLL